MKQLTLVFAILILYSHEARPAPAGVCPPFPLRDETGAIINPVKGVNSNVPYSPKQTCGATGCHDYAKITQGYHFMQGKGEAMPAVYASRYNWALAPGNYGGNWCSPAPLYRQLAPKKNTNARMIDMTSFDFVTATCGNCHPGGGPLEYDRDGVRYDVRMRDPASGMKPGGENGLHGDYFRARWSESGVVEADCLLCHLPEYDFQKRNAQLAALNFRWSAVAGSGLGEVSGKVAAGESPRVEYKKELFDEEGNVTLHIAPQPRNETCLVCHQKPGWKKRGASFSPRTDVHMAKGLKCVDCHTAGSKASDPRIRGREVHQLGKGDDPSGWVRNDLDNTVRDCNSCHSTGDLGAPIAKHSWLPPLHLDRISCTACHIPTRYTKAALVQASDVLNPAPRITPPPKKIWTFYDQDMKFWNHYGELALFTAKDQPTDATRPTLIRYKGKIYPANRVHSSWVGYEEQGKPGLNQLFMRDFYAMWMEHAKDKSKYPELSEIRDDNRDGVVEVNQPREIDALLQAVRAYLMATNFPFEGKRLVYVADNRVYYSSKDYRALPHEPYEATPYASVYKYSHEVMPARSALGAKGCNECHGFQSAFFHGRVLDVPFAEDGASRWMPNYRLLGLSPVSVVLGAVREEWLKPVLYGLMCVLAAVLLALAVGMFLSRLGLARPITAARCAWLLLTGCLAGILLTLASPRLLEYVTFQRFTLDANHFWVSALVMLVGLVIAGFTLGSRVPHPRAVSALASALFLLAGVSALCGLLMIVKAGWLENITRYGYTVFDLSVTLQAAASILLLLPYLVRVGKPLGAPLAAGAPSGALERE